MAPDWVHNSKQPIRSQVWKLTQLLTMTTTQKFPLQAKHMTGRGRAALLAWFAVISNRLASKKNYLQLLAQISEQITKEGRPTVHKALIEELNARIQQNLAGEYDSSSVE